MENESVKAFNVELSSIYESKPPITKTKIQEITKAALKAIKFYKHVVFSVEKFLGKCPPEHKIPVLYIIDSIIRQSKHQYKEKDVYGPRFQKNFIETLNKMMMCPPSDRPKITRTLNLWISNRVYSPEIIHEFLTHCESCGIETDVERVERLVKGDKANMSIYEGKRMEGSRTKEKHHKEHKEHRESKEEKHVQSDKQKHVQVEQSQSSSIRHEATTPPGPPPVEIRLEPSDVTPENGISEKKLVELMKKVAVDFGGVFSADVNLLKKAHIFFSPLLKNKIEKTQDERGDNIKQLLSKDFEYSDDEDNADQNETPKKMTASEIEGLAEILLRETIVIRHLQELHFERIAALNKVATEARQRAAAQQPTTPVQQPTQAPLQPTQTTPSTQGLPSLSSLPPGVQLPGLPALPTGIQLNPALMNLLAANSMLLAQGLPALSGLPQGLSQGLPQGLPPGVPSTLPPGIQLPGIPPVSAAQSGHLPFPPNRPPPNVMQLIQQQHQQDAQNAAAQFAAQAAAQAQAHQQAHVQAQQDALMKQMEEAQAENAKEDRDRRDRDHERTDRSERGERNLDRDRRRDGGRKRDRSRSRDRRDRGDRNDRDSRRRVSRSRDRRGEARDPRERRESRDREEDREKERERRRIGLPSSPKSAHLLVASCTLWFGRLPANCGEDEIKKALQEIGEPKRISLVGSKACAYVTMSDRKTAFKIMDKLQNALNIRGKDVKLSWGVGPGLKSAQSQFGDCWDAEKGISQIPHSKLPTNLRNLVDGSWIDVDTLPAHLKGKVNEFGLPIDGSIPVGDVKLPPGIPPPMGAPPAGFPGFPPGGPNPFMVPPPMLPNGIPFPMNVPPPGMQGGPRTPNKNDPQAVQQQLAAIASGGFSVMPPGFDPSQGGGFVPRGGFRGGRGNFTPRGGGFRGGRGGYGGPPPSGYRHQGFGHQQQHMGHGDNLHSFPRGLPPSQPNDDAQVSSTVNDDAIPLPASEGNSITVVGGGSEMKKVMSEDAMMENALNME